MNKIYSSIIILVLAASISASAQNREAGIRSGYRGGLFYQVTGESGNAETGYNLMVGFHRGIQLTGLKVIYETALSEISPDLHFAWGYGAHAGFMYTDRFSYLNENISLRSEHFFPVVGADGWLAAEYRFREIPVNISINLKPFVELTMPSFVRIIPWDLGISVSYAF